MIEKEKWKIERKMDWLKYRIRKRKEIRNRLDQFDQNDIRELTYLNNLKEESEHDKDN